MDAIGQLAGGVAHGFAQHSHGHSRSCLAAHRGRTPQRHSCQVGQQIVHAAERAAGLTRQLLTFSRRQMQPRRLDMNEVVSNMTKMLDRILGEDIKLQVPVGRSRRWFTDSSMMEQVVLNLAVNARDACPPEDCSVFGLPRWTWTSHVNIRARPGQFICLTATDTGCGIALENMRRIFEPFFTTRKLAKARVWAGHRLWNRQTAPGLDRTRARLIAVLRSDLPPWLGALKAGPTMARGSPPTSSCAAACETILVVEDEYLVRELVSAFYKLTAITSLRPSRAWALSLAHSQGRD